MGLLTRIKLFGTLIALVVVAAFAYQIFDPGPGVEERGRKRNQEVYLRVEFEGLAARPVVVWQVGANKPESETPQGSPWHTTVMAAEGDLIILNVSQKQAGGTRCIIIHRDTVQKAVPMYGPGSISCQYRVK